MTPVAEDADGPDLDAATTGRRNPKSATAFRTISEVADDLNVPQHVLRFWETRFSQIRPLKRAGGRRYYRPEDVDLLKRIRELLYRQGYTIKGVQKLLREGARTPAEAAADAAAAAPAAEEPPHKDPRRAAVEAAIVELGVLRDILKPAARG